eukprot:GHVL01009015.1.p1 GENE.GHVL01009015.1~~GHVL01009015.1.p1  ORF type:complete len:965 (-),score=174.07 GHVL01009015.1:2496-5390(-)
MKSVAAERSQNKFEASDEDVSFDKSNNASSPTTNIVNVVRQVNYLVRNKNPLESSLDKIESQETSTGIESSHSTGTSLDLGSRSNSADEIQTSKSETALKDSFFAEVSFEVSQADDSSAAVNEQSSCNDDSKIDVFYIALRILRNESIAYASSIDDSKKMSVDGSEIIHGLKTLLKQGISSALGLSESHVGAIKTNLFCDSGDVLDDPDAERAEVLDIVIPVSLLGTFDEHYQGTPRVMDTSRTWVNGQSWVEACRYLMKDLHCQLDQSYQFNKSRLWLYLAYADLEFSPKSSSLPPTGRRVTESFEKSPKPSSLETLIEEYSTNNSPEKTPKSKNSDSIKMTKEDELCFSPDEHDKDGIVIDAQVEMRKDEADLDDLSISQLTAPTVISNKTDAEQHQREQQPLSSKNNSKNSKSSSKLNTSSSNMTSLNRSFSRGRINKSPSRETQKSSSKSVERSVGQEVKQLRALSQGAKTRSKPVIHKKSESVIYKELSTRPLISTKLSMYNKSRIKMNTKKADETIRDVNSIVIKQECPSPVNSIVIKKEIVSPKISRTAKKTPTQQGSRDWGQVKNNAKIQNKSETRTQRITKELSTSSSTRTLSGRTSRLERAQKASAHSPHVVDPNSLSVLNRARSVTPRHQPDYTSLRAKSVGRRQDTLIQQTQKSSASIGANKQTPTASTSWVRPSPSGEALVKSSRRTMQSPPSKSLLNSSKSQITVSLKNDEKQKFSHTKGANNVSSPVKRKCDDSDKEEIARLRAECESLRSTVASMMKARSSPQLLSEASSSQSTLDGRPKLIHYLPQNQKTQQVASKQHAQQHQSLSQLVGRQLPTIQQSMLQSASQLNKQQKPLQQLMGQQLPLSQQLGQQLPNPLQPSQHQPVSLAQQPPHYFSYEQSSMRKYSANGIASLNAGAPVPEHDRNNFQQFCPQPPPFALGHAMPRQTTSRVMLDPANRWPKKFIHHPQ